MQGLWLLAAFMAIVCYDKIFCNNKNCSNNAFSSIYAAKRRVCMRCRTTETHA